MSIEALLLVLASAGLHTLWNLQVKRAEDKLTFSACLVAAAAVLTLPPALYLLAREGWPGSLALACALATSLLWLLYYEWVARSYERGDLSVAYPVMRGSAPVAAVGLGLLLGERPTLLGLVGIALIVVAVVGISSSGKHGARLDLGAVAVGIISALYNAIDQRGVQHCHPVLYLWLCMALAALWLGLRTRQMRGPGVWRRAWREQRRAIWLSGAGDFASYCLILLALQRALVMYVVPLRATAVLISVLAGRLALGEEELHRRMAFGVVMLAGIALLAWQG